MLYRSTRDDNVKITSAQAIAQGLSAEGGLFVPEKFPALTAGMIDRLAKMSYNERAAFVLSMYLDDFTEDELKQFTSKVYTAPGFDNPETAPLHKIDKTTHFLELWHGPTSAFKDIALQMLPRLLTAALKKTNEKRKVCILVATSGDTGKAALEGFADVPDTKIMVFYPRDGVSAVQQLQMTSQKGENMNVTAVEGNFDDTQAGIKMIFSDEQLRLRLNEKGYFLSSANSINWGRLVPQIAYYISAYCDLINNGAIKNGESINFCVPTGNFGNILAGYYAKKMGLPVHKLICASNCNNVLTDFMKTGVYNKVRPFYATVSPSMDVLVSSNLERLLFDLSGKDDALMREYMGSLSEKGQYTVTDGILQQIKEFFAEGFCSEEDTKSNIAAVLGEHKYLMDTHTAVAYKVLRDYRNTSNDNTTTVVLSTASAFKFCGSVLESLGENPDSDGTELIDELERLTGFDAPKPLAELKSAKPRFTDIVSKDGMSDAVCKFLGV